MTRPLGHRAAFVTVDGPGGSGKSTTARHLQQLLRSRGYRVHGTAQPSTDHIGQLAREHADRYRGHALACLVAADRYHHLDAEIRPQLATGHVVVCDRYVPSSYVLQRIDGVPVGYVAALNDAATVPDLAVILTVDPLVSANRIARRGAHSRFESGIASSRAEADLYADTVRRLTAAGWPILTADTATTPLDHVIDMIATRINELTGVPHPGSSDE